MMRCLIVDDEYLARKGLEDFVNQTPFLEHVTSVPSALEAMAFLKHNAIDVMFLDIQMPDMTGLELMNALHNPPKVIFTTAHREFALDGFDLNASDFLLKPISYPRFLKAIDKVLSLSNEKTEQSEPHVFIKANGVIIRVLVKDIILVETAKDYVFVHTIKDRYLTLVSLRQMGQLLPKTKFMKVHRSYIVGLDHVQKLEGNLLYAGNQKIKISRALRNDVYKRIVGNNLIGRSG